MIWKTTTATGTGLTASEVRGIGAGTTHLGTPGTSLLGDTMPGMTDGITAIGTILIITEDSTVAGTTLGTGEATGAGMTLGTTLTIIADGTEDGIHTGDITITTDTVRDISEEALTTGTYGTDQDIRQVLTGFTATVLHSEEA